MEVLLTAYRASHPGVEIIVDACEWAAMADLATAREPMFDAVIWATDTPLDGLEGFTVYRDPLKLVVGKLTVWNDAEEIDPLEVLDEVMINAGEFLQVVGQRHYLSDFRNGTAPRCTQRVYTNPDEMLRTVGSGSAVIAMTEGTDLQGFDVRSVPLSIPIHLGLGVLIRADEKRPHVRDFATMGTEIGRALFSMVPHVSSPD
jgi:hypothetical protein